MFREVPEEYWRETTAKLSSDRAYPEPCRAPYVLIAASMANLGGTGVYTRRLLKGFSTTADGRVAAALGRGLFSPREALSMGSNGRTIRKLIQENFLLPSAVKRMHPSLVHLPAFGGRVSGGIPYAVTVHDLAFLRNPRWFPLMRSLY